MTNFEKPKGTNFRCSEALGAAELAKLLCKIVIFLQNSEPYAKLQRYDDWWEHDGLHFYKSPIDFRQLFAIVRSPESLLEAMPGDDYVFVGISPGDGS